MSEIVRGQPQDGGGEGRLSDVRLARLSDAKLRRFRDVRVLALHLFHGPPGGRSIVLGAEWRPRGVIRTPDPQLGNQLLSPQPVVEGDGFELPAFGL
jgi:hypothetical protein